MNYAGLIQALIAETNIEATNAGFVAILPTIINQAEGMIYREPTLDFLSTEIINDSGFTVGGQQLFTLPVFFTVLESINIVNGNDRDPLIKLSRDALNFLFPSRIATGLTAMPRYYAPHTDQTVFLGPTPGGPFQLECAGTARPAPISLANPSTWLWTNLEDLAFAAVMFFASGYMRNWGAQADDTGMGASWLGAYKTLLPGAASEEMRRKQEVA